MYVYPLVEGLPFLHYQLTEQSSAAIIIDSIILYCDVLVWHSEPLSWTEFGENYLLTTENFTYV